MSKVDWSKAPADAQAYMPHSSYWYEGWWKREGTQSYFCEINDAKWQASNAKPWGLPGMVERPKAQGWNGTGLPPVGTVCEARHEDINGGESVKAEILKHHKNGKAAAFFWIDAPAGEPNLLWAGRFTPIRTPEQIAAEEREKAVEEMLALDPYLPNTTFGMMSRADFCRALHDAGYRKQEQPQ